MRLKRDYSVVPTPDQIAEIDFNDHSTQTAAVWGVNVAFLILVAIIVALRIYTRACITRQFFTDDCEAQLFFCYLLAPCLGGIVLTNGIFFSRGSPYHLGCGQSLRLLRHGPSW